MSDERHDKWLAFRNYLHNELKISKEDVRDWVREAIYDVATKYVADNLSSERFHQHVKQVVSDLLNEDCKKPAYFNDRTLKEILASELLKTIDVDVSFIKKK